MSVADPLHDLAAMLAERTAAAAGVLSRANTRVRTRAALLSPLLRPVLLEDARLLGRDVDDLAVLCNLPRFAERALPAATERLIDAAGSLLRRLG